MCTRRYEGFRGHDALKGEGENVLGRTKTWAARDTYLRDTHHACQILYVIEQRGHQQSCLSRDLWKEA